MSVLPFPPNWEFIAKTMKDLADARAKRIEILEKQLMEASERRERMLEWNKLTGACPECGFHNSHDIECTRR